MNLAWKVHRILNKFQRLESTAIRVDDHLTITHGELHTIQAIGEIESVNVTNLANYFGVTKSAASQQVSNLARKGLVTKKQSAHSNKELEISLTELGWQAYELHEEYHGNNIKEIARLLEDYTVTQIATTSSILDVIEKVADERLGDD